VRRHLLRVFEQAAIEQIDSDPRRPEGMAPSLVMIPAASARRTIIRRASCRAIRSDPSCFRPRPPSVQNKGAVLPAPIPAAVT
jgi:hypothetical protein